MPIKNHGWAWLTLFLAAPAAIMLARTRRWVYRNRYNFAVGASVVGAGTSLSPQPRLHQPELPSPLMVPCRLCGFTVRAEQDH